MKEWVVTVGNNVIPTDDLRDHVEGEECWCTPWYDGDVLVHNSADQREVTERAPV